MRACGILFILCLTISMAQAIDCASVSPAQALTAIYTATGGQYWTGPTDNWNSGDPCSWMGVVCANSVPTELYLEGYNMTGPLPEEIGCLPLVELDVTGNFLTSLPASMSQLDFLTTLSAGNNSISSIFGIPPNVKYLTLSHNPLGSLPASFNTLYSLRIARLEYCELSSVSYNFVKLDMGGLHLSHNKITVMPTSMADGPTTVDLSYNPITALPTCSYTSRIKYLHINGCPVTNYGNINSWSSLYEVKQQNASVSSLDPKLTQGSRLNRLYLEYNEFTSVPTVPSGSALRTLRLDHNKISSSVMDCPPIQYMYLSHNQLSEAFSHPSIKYLNLSSNAFTVWPVDHVPNLQKLYASDNAIPNFNIADYPALSHLVLNNNLVSTVPALSGSTLRELRLNNNRITSVGDLGGLSYSYFQLHVGHNQISALLHTPPSSLTTLDVSHNQLTEVPREWGSSLQELYVSHNEITAVPPMAVFARVLHVDHNKLTEYPTLPSYLQELTLSGNPISGPLPDSYESAIENMEVVDIAGFGFMKIPSGLDNLQWENLNLSMNCFKGSLSPHYLGSHSSITGLDVRCTYLTDGPDFSLEEFRAEYRLDKEAVPDYTKDYTACPMFNCPNACEPGEYEKDTFNNCVPCLAGHKCPDMELMSPCALFEYQDEPGQAACKHCTLLNQITNADRTTCTNCTVGSLADAAGEACTVLCGAGSYMEGAVCTTCPEGHKCPGDGYKYLCDPGFVQPVTGAVSCEPCAATEYTNAAHTTCHECLAPLKLDANRLKCGPCMIPGLYDSNGKCRSCERGFECSGDDSMVVCGAGEYNDVTGASACKPCPAATVPSADHTTCETPPAGDYQPSEGGEAEPCPAGRYVPDGSPDACLPCPYDHVCPGDGTMQPYVPDCSKYATKEDVIRQFYETLTLDVDLSSDPCSFSGVNCVSDDEVEIASRYGALYVTGKGSIHPDIGCFGGRLKRLEIHNLQQVASGELHGGIPRSIGMLSGLAYLWIYGFEGPMPAEVDSLPSLIDVSLSGSLTGPVPTFAGSKDTLRQLSLGYSCFSGTIPTAFYDLSVMSSLSMMCTGLTAGDWTREEQRAHSPVEIMFSEDTSGCPPPSCNPCGPGYIKGSIGYSCVPCPAGSYCEDNTVTKCPGGTYSLGGASECTVCAENTWSDEVGRSTECDSVIPEGYFVDPLHLDKLLTCGPGSTLNALRNGCEECPIAHYCTGEGTAPVPCSAGQYQDWSGQGIPLDCSGDDQITNAAHTTCSVCPVPDSIADADHLECLLPCGPGYSGTNDNCTICPKNTFSNTVNAPSCTPCETGYSSPEGASSCDPIVCAAGEYLDGSSCETCPAGTYSAAGAASCTTCEPGYASAAGASACQPCAGFGDAQFCKKATLPDGTAVLVPSTCPDGSYITGDDRKECKKCSADYKCDGTTKHEFTLSPFTSVDPTTASGFLTILVVVLVLAGAAGGTMFALSVKKRTKTAKSAEVSTLGELVVV